MTASQIVGKVATDLIVEGSAAAAYEIESRDVACSLAGAPPLKAAVGKDTVDSVIEAVAAVEEPAAFLAFVSENWQTY